MWWRWFSSFVSIINMAQGFSPRRWCPPFSISCPADWSSPCIKSVTCICSLWGSSSTNWIITTIASTTRINTSLSIGTLLGWRIGVGLRLPYFFNITRLQRRGARLQYGTYLAPLGAMIIIDAGALVRLLPTTIQINSFDKTVPFFIIKLFT